MREWLDIPKGWVTFVLLVFTFVAAFYLLEREQDRVSCERYNKIADASNKRLLFITQVYPLLEFRSEADRQFAGTLLKQQSPPLVAACEE